MATVAVTLSQVSNGALSGGTLPIPNDVPVAKESITPSGTSQATTMVAAERAVWQVTASGAAVWVKFAAAPTASAGNDHLILDGQTREFNATVGNKMAVINA